MLLAVVSVGLLVAGWVAQFHTTDGVGSALRLAGGIGVAAFGIWRYRTWVDAGRPDRSREK